MASKGKKKRHTFNWLIRHPHYGGSAYAKLLRAAYDREKREEVEPSGDNIAENE